MTVADIASGSHLPPGASVLTIQRPLGSTDLSIITEQPIRVEPDRRVNSRANIKFLMQVLLRDAPEATSGATRDEIRRVFTECAWSVPRDIGYAHRP